MNLTVIENKAISLLPVQHQKYVQAKFKPQIKTVEPFILETDIKNLILVSLTEAGLKDAHDSKVTTFLRETLLRDLQTAKYNHLTFEEVKLAVSNGVRGEYGQYMGINIATIHNWLRAFLASKERELALKEFNKKLSEDELMLAEKPLVVKVEQSKAGIKRLFQQYKDTGRLDMVAFAYYNALVELVGKEYKGVKTLITDPEIRKRVTLEQTEKIKTKYLNEKAKMEKRGFLSDSEAIMAKIVNLDKDGEVHRRIKEEFLKIYFDGLIKSKSDLEI